MSPSYLVPLLAYLVPVLARPQSKDSVTEGVKRVAKVRAVKTMAVQHFQGMEHPSDGEAYRGAAAKGMHLPMQSDSQTSRPYQSRPLPKHLSYYPLSGTHLP